MCRRKCYKFLKLGQFERDYYKNRRNSNQNQPINVVSETAGSEILNFLNDYPLRAHYFCTRCGNFAQLNSACIEKIMQY